MPLCKIKQAGIHGTNTGYHFKLLLMSFMLSSKPKHILLQAVTAFLLLIIFSSAGHRELLLNGTVTDSKGKPIPFVSVVIKGTTTGVQSDVKGAFSLRISKLPAVIVVASVGYESKEIRLTEATFKEPTASMAIELAERSGLEEVVITRAYNTKRGRKSTAEYSAGTALEGKASGVLVSSDGDAKTYKTALSADRVLGKDAAPVPAATAMADSVTIKKAGSRTKLLTAGEVNDFKKWTMWEDYQENEFEAHSKKWGLFATQRYAVQLQNKNLSAITGQKIFLTGKLKGDTLWTAVTDNTGKAELWKGFSGNQKENDVEIRVEGELSSYPAIPFSQGMNRIVVQKDCNISSKVEIAFVVDATGSMQDEIDYLKEELEDILVNVAKKDPSLDMHTAAVFYRDKGDAYLTIQSGMKKGTEDAIAFIRKQNADGGGDYPEALNEGLNDAINKIKWSKDARARIIFLLMDAPPHDEAKNEMALLIRQAAAMGIRIVPVACSGTDKSTEFIMRSMALATNGTYLFLTDDSGIGNPHIKPTTDEFKVELLNNLMQRIIEQMCFANNCAADTRGTEPLSPFSNPETVTLFPNPTKGLVTLKTDKKIKELYLTDFAGKILARKVINAERKAYNMDLSGFPSATYFIKYFTTDNKSGAEKVMLLR